jgi:hypothetical protein
MSQALSGSIRARLFLNLTDALDNSIPKDELDKKFSWSITTGTGADQGDRLFHDTRTISANSSEELDIVGSLTDAFGDTFSPAGIKALCVIGSTGNSHNITMGNSTAATFLAGFGSATHTWAIGPGDIFLATKRNATDWDCAAGSTDKLKFTNGSTGNTATYFIALVAAST